MARLTTIGFDADDTLWQNEQFFRLTEARFAELMAEHGEPAELTRRLHTAEMRNLAVYGFGIKGFTLSMVETAIEVSGGAVPAPTIAAIVEAGRDMLGHPVETLPHAAETLEALAPDYRLVLITKGDLFDQERKLGLSGLADYFSAVEIVSDKSAATYRRVFAQGGAENAMMVGNSLRSDIVPAIEAGSWAAFVPHALTWVMEHADPPLDAPRFREIADLSQLPALIGEIGG